MENLSELTGRESGVIIFENDDCILCDWSNLSGIPRVAPANIGLIGLGEELTEIDRYSTNNLAALMDGMDLIYSDMSDEMFEENFSSPVGATIYEVTAGGDTVRVCCPVDWN